MLALNEYQTIPVPNESSRATNKGVCAPRSADLVRNQSRGLAIALPRQISNADSQKKSKAWTHKKLDSRLSNAMPIG
jgi:hypothetical protein